MEVEALKSILNEARELISKSQGLDLEVVTRKATASSRLELLLVEFNLIINRLEELILEPSIEVNTETQNDPEEVFPKGCPNKLGFKDIEEFFLWDHDDPEYIRYYKELFIDSLRMNLAVQASQGVDDYELGIR